MCSTLFSYVPEFYLFPTFFISNDRVFFLTYRSGEQYNQNIFDQPLLVYRTSCYTKTDCCKGYSFLSITCYTCITNLHIQIVAVLFYTSQPCNTFQLIQMVQRGCLFCRILFSTLFFKVCTLLKQLLTLSHTMKSFQLGRYVEVKTEGRLQNTSRNVIKIIYLYIYTTIYIVYSLQLIIF